MDDQARDRRPETGPEGEILEGELGDPDAAETAHASREDRSSVNADRLVERWPTEDQRRGPPGSPGTQDGGTT
jgi:hypothetical protein